MLVPHQRLVEIFQAESTRVLASLVRILGDFDLAEEARQEAFQAALTSWPKDGIPENPRAWLVSAGRFRAIDALRREQRGRQLIEEAAKSAPTLDDIPEDDPEIQDDQLRLVFTCCHPDIPLDSRIALALRTICGLSTTEIARSFLVSEETMKKRLTRAKQSIRNQGIPYEVPSRDQLPLRLDAVLHVIYLVYNEGYSATSGESTIRHDLCDAAIHMGRLLVELMAHPEATGLLALLLLHESRSSVRTDVAGDLVPLEDQDRTKWDQALIAEGSDFVMRSMTSGRVGPYTLQAAIASVHATSPSMADTNWDVIVGYYDLLIQLQESPVVHLHRAIAVGMRDGPTAGLDLIEPLLELPEMGRYHAAHAARADLARRAGDFALARTAYQKSIELARQEPERRFLQKRLALLSKKT